MAKMSKLKMNKEVTDIEDQDMFLAQRQLNLRMEKKKQQEMEAKIQENTYRAGDGLGKLTNSFFTEGGRAYADMESQKLREKSLKKIAQGMSEDIRDNVSSDSDNLM